MASLEGALANVPGLAGYLGQNQITEQNTTHQLGQIGTLIQLQNALKAQQDEQTLRGVMGQSGGDPHKAISTLLSIGTPKSIELASKLKGLVEKPGLQQIGAGGAMDASGKLIPPMARPVEEKPQSIGSGGLRLPTGEIIPPVTQEKPSLKVQMLPVSNTHEQPHQTTDNGKTWTPIPGSHPRPIFNQANVTTPENADSIAKAIAEYRQGPLTGFALRSPGAQEIMRKVMEFNPQYDAKNFATAQQTMNNFSKGPQGNSVRAFNVALEHLDTLKGLTDALGNNDVKRVNQLSQRVAEELGRPAPTNFEAAKQIIAEEIIKAVVTGGGGVTERLAAAEKLSRANSPTQLQGVINTYQDLLVGQLKGLKTQYEGGTMGRKDFEDKYLTPRARDLYKAKQSPPSKSVFDAADAILNGGR